MEIDRWHIIGHDAGAAIAAHFAARFPHAVDRLVLASPPIYPEHQIPWFFRPLRAPVVGELLAPLAAKLIFDVGLVQAIDEDADRSALIRSFQAPFLGKEGARHLLHVLRWGDPTKVLATTASLLPEITAPTLVLHGTRDQAIPIDFAQRAAQDVTDGRCLLADATHFLPLNEPRWMAARILPFLAGALRGCTE